MITNLMEDLRMPQFVQYELSCLFVISQDGKKIKILKVYDLFMSRCEINDSTRNISEIVVILGLISVLTACNRL